MLLSVLSQVLLHLRTIITSVITLTRNSCLLACLVHVLFDLRVVVRDRFADGHESLDRQIYRLADPGDRSQTPIRT